MVANNRILVTGASGFIGRHALVPLQKLGFEVHAVARTSRENVSGIQWHVANLLNPDETSELLQKVQPTHLLHFAWYAEHGKFWNSEQNLEWLSATLRLLKIFVECGGKRFVGSGSCAEYGWDGRSVYEERAPLNPATLYGATKASAYLTGSAFAQTKEITFAWGRIFHLFGPGEFPNRIVPALIRAHLTGEPLDCSQGTQLRDFLPVSAVAEAFAHLCASEVEGAVNIGSGRGVTLRELSEKISMAVDRKADIRFGAFQDSGPEQLVPSVKRLTDEAGWKPPFDFDAGIAETVKWWQDGILRPNP